MIELQRYLTVQELVELASVRDHPISASRISRHIRDQRLRAERRAGSYFITLEEAERFLGTERRPGRPALHRSQAALGLG
jgi:hypothetical protein